MPDINDNCIRQVRGFAPTWGDENSHIGALDFYPIFIPLFERKVSGVSVQRSRWPEKRPV
jgi:hypothetical protein